MKFSGHGFHLVYVISQIICRHKSKKGKNLIQFWENTEDYTIKKIDEACKAIFGKSPVDLSVHDTSRVLRVADTNNCKRGKIYTQWVSISNHIFKLHNFWKGKNQFPELYKQYAHNFNKQAKAHTKYIHRRKHSLTKGLTPKSTGDEYDRIRLNWLISAFYNQKHTYLHKERDLYLFILATVACHVYDTQSTLQLIKNINAQVKPSPLEPEGMKRLSNEILGNYDEAYVSKYQYRTITICGILGIYEESATSRQVNRQYVTHKHQFMKRKQDLNMYKQIQKCMKQHLSYSAIARKYNCSRHYIYNIIRRCKQYKKMDEIKSRDISKQVSQSTQKHKHQNKKLLSRLCHPLYTVGDARTMISHEDSVRNIKKDVKRYMQNRRKSKHKKQLSSRYISRQNSKGYHSIVTNVKEIGRCADSQQILACQRWIYKLQAWLRTGKYLQLGYSRNQILKFIQRII